jgi:hypothetical protein
LQASIVPAFLQGQRRETFKGAQHFFYFHGCKGTKKFAKKQISREILDYFKIHTDLSNLTDSGRERPLTRNNPKD